MPFSSSSFQTNATEGHQCLVALRRGRSPRVGLQQLIEINVETLKRGIDEFACGCDIDTSEVGPALFKLHHLGREDLLTISW
jgi:hypothetical protein